MTKKILILGASRYYIRSIQAAKNDGYIVIVIDRNPESEGFKYADYYEAVDFTDIQTVIEVAKKYKIDGILPLNDYGVPTAAIVSTELGLPGNSIIASKNATNKALMRKAWKEHSVPSARFSVISKKNLIYQAVEEMATWPLIVKPADSRGGGSRGVSKVNTIDELEDALVFAGSFYNDKTVVIEEFLDGKEYSIEAVTLQGKTTILAIGENIKMPEPYRVNKSLVYPSEKFDSKTNNILKEIVDAAIKAIGITIGVSHIELCITKDGPRLIEIGARCGGGGIPTPIVPFVTGIEEIKVAVRLAVGDSPGTLIPKHLRGCVYLFLTPPSGFLKKIIGVKEVKNWDNILDCDVLVKEGDYIKHVRTGADRSGFIIAGGNTREEAISLADKAEKSIVFDIDY